MRATGSSSRHLVDPEIAGLLEVFSAFGFTPQGLPAIRRRLEEMAASRPDAANAYPGVVREERFVPGPVGGPDVRVFVYQQAVRAVAPAGAIVWMHGGGLVLGSVSGEVLFCHQVVDATGATVISVDYRLAPETPSPGPVEDCYAALKWLHSQSGPLSIDTARIAVGGASAGGGLAASLAILARDRAELKICFQMLVYPMLDDRTATTEPAPDYSGEFVWTAADNAFGWRSYLGDCVGGAATSPYAAAARVESTSGLPAAYIGVGSLDLFAQEDIAYAARLIRAGISTELHVYPGGYHGFTAVPSARISQAHIRDVLAALGRQLAE